MRWFAAASFALFLTLSLVATAQIRGMPITPDQRIQVGPAPGSVPAGTPPGIHIGGTIAGPSIGFHHRRYPRTFGFVSPYGPYYYGGYVPYAWDYGADPAYTGYVAGTFDTTPYSGYPYPPQYAPPPSYYSPPPVNSTPEPQSYQQRRSDRASDEFAEPTVLVFRDGHRQEIANYAIMGSTLFVLSGPRSRIPIAELDIPATERVNQSRGVDFHVPAKAQ
jgi:hypothetical protein